jgi:hypothetical protein
LGIGLEWGEISKDWNSSEYQLLAIQEGINKEQQRIEAGEKKSGESEGIEREFGNWEEEQRKTVFVDRFCYKVISFITPFLPLSRLIFLQLIHSPVGSTAFLATEPSHTIFMMAHGPAFLTYCGIGRYLLCKMPECNLKTVGCVWSVLYRGSYYNEAQLSYVFPRKKLKGNWQVLATIQCF